MDNNSSNPANSSGKDSKAAAPVDKTSSQGKKSFNSYKRSSVRQFSSVLSVMIMLPVFVVMIIFFVCFPRSEVSQIEKRTLAKFPEFTVENYFSGKFTNGINQWFTDPEYTNLFDFKTEITRDYTLWIRPMKENRFEAELTYIDHEKTGVGSSDNFSGLKLIFQDNGTADASNGYWVSGLYYNTAFLEFAVKADRDISDALLQLRLSAEWADMYIAPENVTFNDQNYYEFDISCTPAQVDDTTGEVKKDLKGYALFDTEKAVSYDYSPIAITGAISFSESMVDKRPFTDYLVNEHFALSEGWNVIRLTVANNHAPYDGTMEATAPMIDCLSIFTDGGLEWNPMTENLADPEKLNN